MIRVIIADDHHLVRQGLIALLNAASDIDVIGEAATGEEAVSLVESLRPEVVVMDVSMPRLDGRQATERIKALNLPTEIVILSMHADVMLVKQLLQCGVRGYLLKRSVSDELLLAIRAASRGEVYLSPAISNSVMSLLMAPPGDNPPESVSDLLTPREQEVLQLIAEGHTNNAIADILTISVKTVEKHRANLMGKLEVNDLPTLIRKAIKHGLIFPEP
jgi:two-component system, NarL family, response regulator NreC